MRLSLLWVSPQYTAKPLVTKGRRSRSGQHGVKVNVLTRGDLVGMLEIPASVAERRR
ncbi:MAG: hypothetical protein ACRD22_13410 [Terriglobia bacterium]